MQKKLKKAHKEAIPFTWDTTPVIVNARGAYVEEMFLDAWTDFLYGGGWTDTEELTFREANWVLVSHLTKSQVQYSFNEFSCRSSTSCELPLRPPRLPAKIVSSYSRSLCLQHTRTSWRIRSRKNLAGCSPGTNLRDMLFRPKMFKRHPREMKQNLTPFFVVIPRQSRSHCPNH
jgi:hypothetical protein